jgi:hypothetical protein
LVSGRLSEPWRTRRRQDKGGLATQVWTFSNKSHRDLEIFRSVSESPRISFYSHARRYLVRRHPAGHDGSVCNSKAFDVTVSISDYVTRLNAA